MTALRLWCFCETLAFLSEYGRKSFSNTLHLNCDVLLEAFPWKGLWLLGGAGRPARAEGQLQRTGARSLWVRIRAAVRADPLQGVSPLLPKCPQPQLPQQTIPRSEPPPSPKSEAWEQRATPGAAVPWMCCSDHPARLRPPASRPHLPGPAAQTRGCPRLSGRARPWTPLHRRLAGAGPGPGESPTCSSGAGQPRCRLPESPGSRGRAATLPRHGRLLPATPHLRRPQTWLSPARWDGPGAGQGRATPRPLPAPAQVSGSG